MRLTALLHFYRVRLRSRIVAELLAVAGIAVGVALVFAALVASASLTGSVRQLSDGIVGAASLQLAARSPEGFGQRVTTRVDAIEGVEGVAPVVEARAALAGPRGRRSVLLVGGDPRFARFGGKLLRNLAHAGRGAEPGLALPAPLVVHLGLEVNQRLRVETGSGVTSVRLAKVLGTDEVGSLAQSPVAVGPMPLVQGLAGIEGRVSRVFVKAAPGRADAVATALRRIGGGRLDVLPADQEVAVFARAAYPTNQSTAVFSALSALVGFLFALSAMLLTVPQRRRLIAELRLAGYGPWVVVELLLFDALVLGAVGSILGLTLGDQASRHLFDSAPGYLSSTFAIGSQRIVTWQSVATASAAGMAAAVAAVLAPVRDALSRNPLRQEGVTTASNREGRWTAAGASVLAIAAAIAVLAPRAGMAGLVALTLGLLLLLPLLMRRWASLVDRLARRRSSPVALLAALELSSGVAKIRTLALAATGAIAVFATVSIGGAHADLQRGLDDVAADVDRGADIWLALRGPANIFATNSFDLPEKRVEAIERLPGVRRVRRHGGAFLDVGDYRAWVLAAPRSQASPVPLSQIREGPVPVVEARVRAGGWLALSQGLAADLGVGVGDRLRLPSPVPTAFWVAGLSTNVGWPGGAIAMNAADFARAWGSRSPSAIGIEVDRGASQVAVARRVRRALGPRSPLLVETREARLARGKASSRAGLTRLGQISTLVLIAAILAMVVAMGGVIWQRRPTLSALKVHGFGERELWGSLLLESGLLLGAGCLAGAVFGLLGQILLDRALEAITGFPVIYVPAAPLATFLLALVTGVAVAMLAIPGWLAVRVRPVAGLPG
jgi:putative ABC transport system permease protein